MSNVRKLVSVRPAHFPNKKIAAKVKKTVLGGQSVKFFTRKDLDALVKHSSLAKAPNTVKFLKGLRDKAKKSGAFYVRLEA